MNEGATEWQEPKESEKDGETCDDLCIDEAGFGSVAIALIVDAMEVIASDTSNDSCKG